MGANASTAVPLYASGQVLDAARLNLTNAGVPVFSGTATRDAAFDGSGEKVLAEGQLCYLEDSNSVLYYDSSAWQSVGAAPTVAIFNETQANGTAGGSSVATTWSKRVLNTTIVNNIGATLTSSVIALLAGSYEVEAFSPFLLSNSLKIKLRNTTDSTNTTKHTQHNFDANNSVAGAALLQGYFVITATKNFELQYWVKDSAATNGLGTATAGGTGVSEIYSTIKITKVA